MIEGSNMLSPQDEAAAIEFFSALGVQDAHDIPMLNFRHVGEYSNNSCETRGIEIPREESASLQREI